MSDAHYWDNECPWEKIGIEPDCEWHEDMDEAANLAHTLQAYRDMIDTGAMVENETTQSTMYAIQDRINELKNVEG
jgi:hypothetical protein